jgi:hypothetical protein
MELLLILIAQYTFLRRGEVCSPDKIYTVLRTALPRQAMPATPSYRRGIFCKGGLTPPLRRTINYSQRLARWDAMLGGF